MDLIASSKLARPKSLGIPWNSKELLVSLKLAYSEFHGFALKGRAIILGASSIWIRSTSYFHFSSHEKFHGIPWIWLCHWNWPSQIFMEFHETIGVIESFKFEVIPRNTVLSPVVQFNAGSLINKIYRQISNIRRTKSQNSNVTRLVLKLSVQYIEAMY